MTKTIEIPDIAMCEETEIKYLGQDDIRDYIMKKDYEIYRLQQRINKTIEYIHYSLNNPLCDEREALKYTLDILRGKDNERN